MSFIPSLSLLKSPFGEVYTQRKTMTPKCFRNGELNPQRWRIQPTTSCGYHGNRCIDLGMSKNRPFEWGNLWETTGFLGAPPIYWGVNWGTETVVSWTAPSDDGGSPIIRYEAAVGEDVMDKTTAFAALFMVNPAILRIMTSSSCKWGQQESITYNI